MEANEIRSTDQFLERMQARPFVDMSPINTNPMQYHIWAPPVNERYVPKFAPPLKKKSNEKKSTLGFGNKQAWATLSVARALSFQDSMSIEDIEEGAAFAYLGLAERFGDSDIQSVMEHSGEWASMMLKGWATQMKSERLGWKLKVESLDEVEVLGVEVFVQGAQAIDPDYPDSRQFVAREIESAAGVTFALWLAAERAKAFDGNVSRFTPAGRAPKSLLTRILTYPRRLFDTIQRTNVIFIASFPLFK
jgi:hypothetical protein